MSSPVCGCVTDRRSTCAAQVQRSEPRPKTNKVGIPGERGDKKGQGCEQSHVYAQYSCTTQTELVYQRGFGTRDEAFPLCFAVSRATLNPICRAGAYSGQEHVAQPCGQPRDKQSANMRTTTRAQNDTASIVRRGSSSLERQRMTRGSRALMPTCAAPDPDACVRSTAAGRQRTLLV